MLADIASVEQRITRQRRAAKSGDKEILAEVEVLEKANALLSDGTPIRRGSLTADEIARLAPVFLLTTKPLLIVANTGEELTTEATLPPGDEVLAVPIDIEAEIAACAPEDRAEMRESYGLGESALDAVAQAAYLLLGPAHVLHHR